jgi:glucose-1-phosphate thymidylyltransferase
LVEKIAREAFKVKGIILAGGSGTRLNPLTKVIGKQLLPVYDKPMIYYPLSTLILAGVTEVLVISTPVETDRFRLLLGNGGHLGIKINYKIQSEPKGLAHGIQLGEEFIENEGFWFILGDNLFHGPEFGTRLSENQEEENSSQIFAYRVSDPSQYGVVRFSDEDKKPVEIIEKPEKFISHWAIPGLYYFDHTAVERAKSVKPSIRGELEIVDVLRSYLSEDRLLVKKISRGNAWFDLGTPENLLTGSHFVHLIQTRQGMLVGSPEEASFRKGHLSLNEILANYDYPKNSFYEKSITSIVKDFE